MNAFPINFWVCKQRERQKIFAANLANFPIVAAVKVLSFSSFIIFLPQVLIHFFPLTLSLPGGPSHYLFLQTLWEKMMMFGEKTDLIIITTGYCFLLFRLANDGLGEWDWLTYFSVCNSITPRSAGKKKREKKTLSISDRERTSASAGVAQCKKKIESWPNSEQTDTQLKKGKQKLKSAWLTIVIMIDRSFFAIF